ncbi:unnamed protein product [Tilletia caries]|nr:unnamed protein product [Tilletia caries]
MAYQQQQGYYPPQGQQQGYYPPQQGGQYPPQGGQYPPQGQYPGPQPYMQQPPMMQQGPPPGMSMRQHRMQKAQDKHGSCCGPCAACCVDVRMPLLKS